MFNRKLYEDYHNNIKLQNKIITNDNFTYRNILYVVSKFLPKKGKLLDIGSATGTLCFYFASKNLDVDGIEISKNAVKFSNLNKKRLGITNVRFKNTSIEKFNSNSLYNIVTCFEVLEHIFDDIKAVKKINKFMIKNSTLIISVPSQNAPLYKLGLSHRFDKKVGHLRRYSISSISNILLDNGFTNIKVYRAEGLLRNLLFTNKYLGFLIKFMKFKWINNIFSYLDNYTIQLFGESQLIIVCKKI